MSVSPRSPRILLVSTSDVGGGAELSAWNLFNAYRRRGYAVQLAVGRKRTADQDVLGIDNDAARSQWARFWSRVGDRIEPVGHRLRDNGRLRDLALWTGEPLRSLDLARGREDFRQPGTWQLLRSGSFDVVHCFNLHGGYFDLRILPALSRRCPVILDLRDAWLLSGHCSHSLGCERWKSGCGQCPDLNLYPPIRRDATAYNWRRKQRIFARSRLHVASPSEWMMRKVRESMLGAHAQDMRVVPTGVDLGVFNPGDKTRRRLELDIPLDAKVLLFVAYAVRRNYWKDFQMLASAFRLVRERMGQKLLLVGVGDEPEPTGREDAGVRFIPHQKNAVEVAKYYQAADVYVHAAVVDTFPRSVVEALACGTPVIGTCVGGIPEQIRDLGESGDAAPTGALVPPGDAEALAGAIERLLTNDSLREQLSRNAAADARNRFDLQKQADSYLGWYASLIAGRQPVARTVPTEPRPDVVPSAIGLNR
jgi:glycosyltransferase involved in cell wall biosynthesis